MVVGAREAEPKPADASRVPLVHESCTKVSTWRTALSASSVPSSSLIAADLMIGLKTMPHSQDGGLADSNKTKETPKRLPDVSSKRPRLPAIPPLCDAEKAPVKGAGKTGPPPLTSFLGKRAKHDDEHDTTSPTSVWEATNSSSIALPTSMQETSPVTALVPPIIVPTVASWSVVADQSLGSPNIFHEPALTPPGVPVPPASGTHPPTPVAATNSSQTLPSPCAAAMRQPVLIRRVSAEWRHDVKEQDRSRTRERIHRALSVTCQDDYDALLRVIVAMEEELLHINCTSKQHFFHQAFALSNRIANVQLPPH
ncbi:TPA: hypothetical protein N0F65_012915 [Lagenidium giganteum]|uniref:Uncharacterized protein n=1 Tax=Lagenidium giganteum TaxID=4803 RepID=A0AAV2YTK2_9STRA|nr:TPA: hypothetical protein N0F65_012915 [Lagenidium giganteum]